MLETLGRADGSSEMRTNAHQQRLRPERARRSPRESAAGGCGAASAENHVTQTKFSVNVNKVATIRNSRGGHLPSVTEAVRVCVAAGAPGITVHPTRRCAAHHVCGRARGIGRNCRPITPGSSSTSRAIRGRICWRSCTRSGPISARSCPSARARSRARRGGRRARRSSALQSTVRDLQRDGVRVSVFIDPDLEAVRWAASLDADRIELYTEPYARAFARRRARTPGELRAIRRRRNAGAQPRRRHQRRTRSRSRQPDAVPHAAAPRRSVDRPRAHQPCALRRAREGGQGLFGGSGVASAHLR